MWEGPLPMCFAAPPSNWGQRLTNFGPLPLRPCPCCCFCLFVQHRLQCHKDQVRVWGTLWQRLRCCVELGYVSAWHQPHPTEVSPAPHTLDDGTAERAPACAAAVEGHGNGPSRGVAHALVPPAIPNSCTTCMGQRDCAHGDGPA